MTKRITGITSQKRNKNRLNIELDGEFAFGLDRMVAAWLNIGQELDDQKIAELQAKDAGEVLYQSALRLLSYKPRTASELQERLIQKGFELEAVNTMVDRLISNHLLDDEQYAKSWVDDRGLFKPRSHRLMAMELRQKGLSEETIHSAISSAAGNEELAAAAGKKVIRRWKGLEQKEFQTKCFAYLARKGFSYGEISSVMPELWKSLKEI